MTYCIICGADIYTPDYYGQIRRKYCKACAAAVQRENKRAWAAERRQAQREINAQTRTLCELQKEHIRQLKDEILRLREAAERNDDVLHKTVL